MLAACGRYTAKRLSVAPKFQVFGAHTLCSLLIEPLPFLFLFLFSEEEELSLRYDCLARPEKNHGSLGGAKFSCRSLETGRPELQCSGLFLAQQCSTARLCLHPSLLLSCSRVSEIVMSEMSSSSNGASFFLSLVACLACWLLLLPSIMTHECC